MSQPQSGQTYRDAGVDFDAAEAAKQRIKALAATTHGPEVLGGVGGFGGLFELSGYRQPVLVSGTDNVGTKLKIALAMGQFENLGTRCRQCLRQRCHRVWRQAVILPRLHRDGQDGRRSRGGDRPGHCGGVHRERVRAHRRGDIGASGTVRAGRVRPVRIRGRRRRKGRDTGRLDHPGKATRSSAFRRTVCTPTDSRSCGTR